MTIAKKLQLFSGQTPPRSTSVEGKGREGKGKGREGKAREGKTGPLQKFGSRQTRKDISARPCNETANYGTKT
ncbi:MAG: hypothetical protein ACLTW0_04970 [Alistipes ihumii]